MPFPPPSRRRLGRACASAALALGLAGSLIGVTGTAGAAAEARTADAADATTAASTTLTVAPTEPVLLETDESYSFTAQVDNPGETAFAGGQLRLELSTAQLASEGELAEPFPARGAFVAEMEVGETGAESEQAVTLTVQRDELPLSEAKPGVYRMRATLTRPRSDRRQTITPLTAETTIVWRGVEESRARLTTLVPIVLPTDVRSMPSKKQLDEASPRFDALLDAAAAARATLAIDPRIIAAIRGYGDDAPLQARRFLERLEASPLPSFLLQFADADPSAQAALGYTELLEPASLDYVIRQGSFPAEEVDGEKLEPVLPTLDELLAWPQQEQPTAWPANGQVDRATLDLLQKSGISDVILDSSNVTQTGGPRAALGRQSTLIADAGLDAAIRSALGGVSESARQAGFADAAARLALAAQSGSTGRVLALDRGTIADAENPAALLERLVAYDWVTATPAADQQAGTAVINGVATLEERRELLRSAAGREAEVTEVGAVLEHPEDLMGYQRARLLDLFATPYAAPDAGFETAAELYAKRDDELKLGVRAISTEHTQIVGTSTRIPIQLHNSLPFDALVDVRVDPASAALSVSKRGFPRVAIPAGGNARILVPVHSRVSSGESAIRIEVTDTSGAYRAYSGTLPLSISSSVETIALWILGLSAALLLVFGTIRSLRRRRRNTASDAPVAE